MLVSDLITELQAQDPTAIVKLRVPSEDALVPLEEVVTSPLSPGVVVLAGEAV